MANSRLERIGTIYSRITGLLRVGAVKPENKPIWYDVYQHFPPKYAPKFDRPEPNMEVPKIFYPEDVIRAKIHKEKGFVGAVNLSDISRPSNTQKCLQAFEELKDNSESESRALKNAIEKVSADFSKREKDVNKVSSVAEDFRKAKAVKIENLFDEKKT